MAGSDSLVQGSWSERQTRIFKDVLFLQLEKSLAIHGLTRVLYNVNVTAEHEVVEI